MATRRRATPEQRVQVPCIGVLEAFGLRAHRRNVTRVPFTYKGKTSWVRFNEPGMSDLWTILPSGVHLEVEVKAPGEVPTPEQVEWLVSVNLRGGIGIWTDDAEWLREVLPHLLDGYRVRLDPHSLDQEFYRP